MEKGKGSVVYLAQRDSGHVGKELKKVDWDGLVEDVFKEEVDHFIIESGVQSLNIRQNTNSWCVNQPSTSNLQQWRSPITTSSTSYYDWNGKASDQHNQSNKRLKPSSPSTSQSWWQKNQMKSATSSTMTANQEDFTSSHIQKHGGSQTMGDLFLQKP
jgi:hypothetical protein